MNRNGTQTQSTRQERYFQCTLHATVPSKQIDKTLNMIELHCHGDNPRHDMKRYERVYMSDRKTRDGSCIRASCDLSINNNNNNKIEQWYVQYLGQPHMTYQHDILIHPIQEVSVSDNYETMLTYMDYKLDYEYVQQGYRFIDNINNVEILCYQLCQLPRKNDLTSIIRIAALSKRWMIELRCIESGSTLNTADKRLIDFSKQFLPDIVFHKVIP